MLCYASLYFVDYLQKCHLQQSLFVLVPFVQRLNFNFISVERTIKDNIHPTENEAEIFRLLRDCVSRQSLPVTLRVAGGWVRDKVFGGETKYHYVCSYLE